MIAKEHGVGAPDGTGEGIAEGGGDGGRVIVLSVGAGDGIGVGVQIGGLPSGDGENIGLLGRHSSGQQSKQPFG